MTLIIQQKVVSGRVGNLSTSMGLGFPDANDNAI